MQKLLFIRYEKPTSGILDGGSQATQKNIDVLSSILGENNIDVYYICDGAKDKTYYLKGFFFMLKNYFLGLTSEKVKEILSLAPQYDYIFIDRSVYGILAKKLREAKYCGKIITFFHNIERLYFEAKIPRWIPGRQIILKCADKNDAYSCRYSDKIIALNLRDNLELERRYKRRADELIPITFKDKLIEKKNEQLTNYQPTCMFLGSYFPANNEGVLWFIKNVFPAVKIKMIIVGKGMSKLREGNSIPNEIEIYSNVPEIEPFLEEADFMIFPIFKGSGMKVKTCESLMYGKNILASTEAFEGYELDYDKVGGLCNTADEYIAKINHYSQAPIPRFNRYARQIFLEKYSEDVVLEKFKALLFD